MGRMAAVAYAAFFLAGASCDDRARTDAEPARLPPESTDPVVPPDAEMFLPPLRDFRTDDEVDAGEIRASLDHGDVPYVEVRRRLLLNPEGFQLGDIMVITFRSEGDGAEQFLKHWFGDFDRAPVEIAGIDMLRIAAEPHDALVWKGPHFLVVFGRGQETSPQWLEEVARATVEGIR